MDAPRQLRELGQSLWLDQITRDLLDDGTLARYVRDFGITGLTSNPTIFDAAIGGGKAYDADITRLARLGKSGEEIFLDLELADLRRAADLFRPIYDETGGADGWASLELSPLLAADTKGSIAAAERIYREAGRTNLFIKIPGTPQGIPAIEESIYRGVPVNVTLLFSREQYLAAAEAYLRGIEWRLAAGRDPRVASVASVFVSRWDKAVETSVPSELRNRLGLAVARQTYRAYCELLASSRWWALAQSGARPQRLLWASTGSKDPAAPDTLYVDALAAPQTINTLPERTLHAVADHGQVAGVMDPKGGDAEPTLAAFAKAGLDADALAEQLQVEGATAFVKSWNGLMQRIADKSGALGRPARRA
ncbi:MAG TPA: transaldolase [Vicinamibacterales bacterium]|nr:transaldolase [Vicinamibacterales bacterium]